MSYLSLLLVSSVFPFFSLASANSTHTLSSWALSSSAFPDRGLYWGLEDFDIFCSSSYRLALSYKRKQCSKNTSFNIVTHHLKFL